MRNRAPKLSISAARREAPQGRDPRAVAEGVRKANSKAPCPTYIKHAVIRTLKCTCTYILQLLVSKKNVVLTASAVLETREFECSVHGPSSRKPAASPQNPTNARGTKKAVEPLRYPDAGLLQRQSAAHCVFHSGYPYS